MGEIQSIAQVRLTSFDRNNPDQIKMCFKAKESNVFETIFD